MPAKQRAKVNIFFEFKNQGLKFRVISVQ